MNLQRINAILLQELFISLRSLEVIVDIIVFPLINVIMFGFLDLYLSGSKDILAGQYVLLGMLLWQIIWVIEYSICSGCLWNMWSRNLSNLFITPLMAKELIFAYLLSGIGKAVILLLISGILSFFLFNFNILMVGNMSLLLIFINFTLFAFAVGIAMLGVIFRYGTRLQAAAWGLIPIFQPLSAAFYPLHVLPLPLQYVAYLFPPTFTFEAARYSLAYHLINWQLFGISFVENIFYCLLCTIFFIRMFNKSRKTGQFARNEA